MNTPTIIIAGAGQAGYQTAASLRQEGWDGRIVLIGDEPGLPYQRPPLSKAYLLGKVPASTLRFRPAEWYEQNRVELIEARVTAIQRGAHSVTLANGQTLPYSHLVLALGARNRVPDRPGIDLDGVFGLRTLADADALAPRLADARRAVVVGAGFIGLEFAAVAAARGIEVDVLEVGTRPMARALSEPMSSAFDSAHRSWGVRLHYGEGLYSVLGTGGRVTAVRTTSGKQIAADIVVYGIGVVPNVELASAAGLTVDNGVRVDALLQTDDPDISAIGDLVSFPCPWTTQPVRLESVQNAVDQARAVAARLAGKAAAPYSALPWFWTDQGDMKLQIAGLSDGTDNTVVLGDTVARQFSVLCFRSGKLVAVESCNRTSDHMAARKLLARHTDLRPEQASEPGFDLKAFEAATRPSA
ncbi:NAD(P)/FAD-dependent oxidoreductase [Caldimonas thermodepolymerans]|jgi:3-phenylpropionate/trans-cinnamate dioxygenase ferredoxin reductase subunit|uniref:NAD(P)/FAD-dependent oxidoreductase n=1 Tax=Caldimonas thermodepolymerans TaxID=215580 RepID=UPI00223581C3|nr:FAD-dependent oxidoreductase [Caldimonas thermodepolymerans]UZG46075.1 FAD-dependent oxidoreductase [Caldimonas thermodepolymerans]